MRKISRYKIFAEQEANKIFAIIFYYVRENVQGKIFCDFHGFSLDCKSFPVNYDLVDQQYNSKELLQQTFYRE